MRVREHNSRVIALREQNHVARFGRRPPSQSRLTGLGFATRHPITRVVRSESVDRLDRRVGAALRERGNQTVAHSTDLVASCHVAGAGLKWRILTGREALK